MQISNQIKSIAYGVLISSFFTMALQGEAKGATLVNQLDTLNQTPAQIVSVDLDLGDSLNTPKSSTRTNLVTSGLLNGSDRTLTVEVTNAQNGRAIGRVPINSTSPGFSLSNDVGVTGNAILSYSNFSSIDFTQGGADRLLFNIVSSDKAANNVSVNVNGDVVTRTIGIVSIPMEIEFLFSEFDVNTDFSSVTSFALGINTTAVVDGDVSINVFATGKAEVPEPSALIPILGLGGLIFTSRRKKPNQDKNDKID